MICEKCGTPFDGKHKLCHECRSIYAYEGIPVRVVEEKPVVSKAKKTTPKAASPAVDTEQRRICNMTICLETTIYRWNGQSGEMVNITDAPEGSTFHAVDTGAQLIFHNGGWVNDLRTIYALKAAAI